MKLPRRKFLHLTAGAAALSIVSHAARAGHHQRTDRRQIKPGATSSSDALQIWP
jgi:hypothetical protein